MFRFKRKFELGRRCRRVGGRATPFVTMLGLLALSSSLTVQANIVADWDAIAATTIAPPAGTVLPPAVTEAEQRPIFQVDLGSVHLAIYDAVNAIDRKHAPFAIVPEARGAGASQ